MVTFKTAGMIVAKCRHDNSAHCMLLTLEILLLLGAIVLPLVPRKAKQKNVVKPHQPAREELSNYVVNADGNLEEINNPHDSSLFQ